LIPAESTLPAAREMIDATEEAGHRGCSLLQLALERAQDRLLRDHIDHHLERQQHDQQEPDGLRGQTDADPPHAFILRRRGTP
jgi:hypothetical protein